MKKTGMRKRDSAEMRMPRRMCGVTRENRISKEYIRGSTKITEVYTKEGTRGKTKMVWTYYKKGRPPFWKTDKGNGSAEEEEEEKRKTGKYMD